MKPEDRVQSEARLDALLRRAIAELPAPAADLTPLVLARIAARPSPLTVALQLAVLVVLGLSAAALLPWGEVELRWPDLSAGLELSTRAMSSLHGVAAGFGSMGGSVPEANGRSLELASALVVGLIVLNLRAAWRPAAAGGGR